MTQAAIDASSTPVGKPARRSQAERREESRRRMLDAAFELLSERQGIGFTLSDVGERAGYSRGLPTQTFGTLMSMEPAIAALSGFAFLGETLAPVQWLAIGAVMFASAGTALTARPPRPLHD